MFKHDLGMNMRSVVLGIAGTVTARSENLYGCNRYYIQPKAGADNKVPDGYWCDEADLTSNEPEVAKVARENNSHGGPPSRDK